MKNNRLILLLLLTTFLFAFTGTGLAHAFAFEVQYPTIPGLTTPSADCIGNNCIPIYISYWFGLLVYVAGTISIISFIVGAIGLINPNIEAHNDAKDRMKGAILGLVLTMASFIIMKTINPSLTTPSLTALSTYGPGIYYYSAKTNERKDVRPEVPDVSQRGVDLKVGEFNYLMLDCGRSDTGLAILIWEFPRPGFEGGNPLLDTIRVVRKTCSDNTERIDNLGSFRWEYDSTGVYFCYGDATSSGCSGNMCAGYMSKANYVDQNGIPDPFAGHVKGVRIVGNYGVVLHKVTDLNKGGYCNYPLVNWTSAPDLTASSCQEVDDYFATKAANIFVLNNSDIASGDGVDFYSRPFGEVSGIKAGIFSTIDESISSNVSQDIWNAGDEMCFDYTGTNEPQWYQYRCTNNKCNKKAPEPKKEGVNCSDRAACETFQDCPGSIDFKGGDYLVAIYADYTGPNMGSSDLGMSAYCKTFKSDARDLEAQPIVPPGAMEGLLGRVYIIPIE